MAKLGEAYVRVRADLEPFAKDLDNGLRKLTDKFEKSFSKEFGKKLGTQIGTGTKEGLAESTKELGVSIEKKIKDAEPKVRAAGKRAGRKVNEGVGDGLSELGPVRRGLASLTSALEDGFSALPPEIKAIVGGLIIGAIVPAGAFIGAAFTTAVVAGVAGVGVALASQFQEVQDRWMRFADFIRDSFISNAAPFIGPVIESLDLFENRINALDPLIERVFGRASQFVVPLAEGVADLIEGIFGGLDRGLEKLDLDLLSETLIDNFEYLGDSIGDVIELLLSNPNVPQAFEDLLTVTGDLVYAGGELLSWTLDMYAASKNLFDLINSGVRDLIQFADVINEVVSVGDNLDQKWNDFISTDLRRVGIKQLSTQVDKEYNSVLSGTIVLTKDQEKAVKDLNKQLDTQYKLVNDVISTEIDYQEAVDATNEALKENHASLDLTDEKGRAVAEAIQGQINKLNDFTEAQVTSGKMTEDQAQRYYNNEITRLEKEFRKRGGNIKQFEEIFGWLIKLQGAPVIPDKFGPFRISLKDSLTLINAVITATNTLANAPKAAKPNAYQGGQQKYADGGFITAPTMAIMGEGYKPELVLPLTQPGRSAQLLAQSPLAGALGSAPIVNVYVGNEQLDARMYQVASSVGRNQGRVLSQKPRNI